MIPLPKADTTPHSRGALRPTKVQHDCCHCERSEAIQNLSRCEILDCFVAVAPRNDGPGVPSDRNFNNRNFQRADMTPRSRGAVRPRFAGFSALFEPRAQGRPGARCTRGLVCTLRRRTAHEHTGTAESIWPSLRSGFTAYAVLSPATNSFLSPSLRELMASRTGWLDVAFAKLDSSNGCQDHTILPYAACAVRLARR